MPGFNIGGFGAEDATNHKIETRRKHRWKFTALGGNVFDASKMLLLRGASRPSFTLEEAEMHHNEEVVYFAGRRTWDTVELTWYDAENDPDMSMAVEDWLLVCVNFEEANTFTPEEYKTEANLEMLNGVGESTEIWKMYGCWPKEVNWNELAYDDTDIAEINVVMRYDRALREQPS